MNLLLVDIGNTYAKFKLNNKLFSIETSLIEETYSFIDKYLKLDDSFDFCVISSVSIGKDIIIRDYIKGKYNVNSLIIDKSLNFRIKYPLVNNELGSDLISIMEGIKDKTFIAISLGTASVFMAVKNNEFIGCSIAPGLLTSLNGLISSASLINDTELFGEYDLLGLDTKTALRSGTFNSFKYIVDGFINEISNKYEMKDSPIYMVGGFSKIISEKIGYKVIVDNDLVFNGLKAIYKLNKEECHE